MNSARRLIPLWDKLGPGGFTLVELVIVIVLLGILAAVAVPRFANMTETAKTAATKDEMNLLKRAIIGNPAAVSAGAHIERGFEGDIGHPPVTLSELAAKPDSLPAYNRLTRLGWNGPYVDSASGNYLTDGWGIAYVYQPAGRRILSVGGPDTITVTF